MKPGQGVTLRRDLPTTGPFFVPAGTAGIVLFAYPTWARVAWQGYGEATANISDLKPATLLDNPGAQPIRLSENLRDKLPEALRERYLVALQLARDVSMSAFFDETLDDSLLDAPPMEKRRIKFRLWRR